MNKFIKIFLWCIGIIIGASILGRITHSIASKRDASTDTSPAKTEARAKAKAPVKVETFEIDVPANGRSIPINIKRYNLDIRGADGMNESGREGRQVWYYRESDKPGQEPKPQPWPRGNWEAPYDVMLVKIGASVPLKIILTEKPFCNN